MKHYIAARTTGICSLAAGILHTTIVAVVHWTVFPPLEGIFFVAGGIVQITLGAAFMTAPTIFTYRMSLLINGGMATLYTLLLFLPVPFAGKPEAASALGIVVTVLELVAVATSVRWLLTHTEHGENRAFVVTSAAALSLMLLSGFGYYSGAQSMAMMLPERTIQHDHHHGMDMHDIHDQMPHEETEDTENTEEDHHNDDHPH